MGDSRGNFKFHPIRFLLLPALYSHKKGDMDLGACGYWAIISLFVLLIFSPNLQNKCQFFCNSKTTYAAHMMICGWYSFVVGELWITLWNTLRRMREDMILILLPTESGSSFMGVTSLFRSVNWTWGYYNPCKDPHGLELQISVLDLNFHIDWRFWILNFRNQSWRLNPDSYSNWSRAENRRSISQRSLEVGAFLKFFTKQNPKKGS